MCFKYSNIVINRHTILASFGMMHLFGTSIAFWIGTIIDDAVDFYTQHHLNEAAADIARYDNDSSLISGANSLISGTSSLINYLLPVDNAIGEHNHLEGHNYAINGESVPGSAAILAIECIQSVSPSISSSKIFPYMYPFTIEYNVCLAVLWYLVWDQIGNEPTCDEIDTTRNKSQSNTNPNQSNANFSNANYHNDNYQNGNDSNDDTNQERNQNEERDRKKRRLSDFHPSLSIGEKLKVNVEKIPDGNRNNYSDIFEHLDMADGDTNHRYEHDNDTKYDENDAYSETGITIRADCHASNKGLFAGLFILLFMIVTMIMFFISLGSSVNFNQSAPSLTVPHKYGIVNVTIVESTTPRMTTSSGKVIGHSVDSSQVQSSESTHAPGGIPKYIFHIQETLLTFFIFLSTVIAYKHVSKFDIVHMKLTSHTTDIILLIVPLVFYFINNILSIAAEATYQNWFRVGLLTFITIQVIFQAVFIIDASHRRIDFKSISRFKKPGREFITFSILLNITSWIVYTFESKAVEPYLNEASFYGSTFWMIVSHTTLPLMLFYRFHCSVCLADIWKFSYDPSGKNH